MFINFFTVLIHLDYSTVCHESTIVGHGLDGFFVVCISKFRLQVFVKSGDFVLIRVEIEGVSLCGFLGFHL